MGAAGLIIHEHGFAMSYKPTVPHSLKRGWTPEPTGMAQP